MIRNLVAMLAFLVSTNGALAQEVNECYTEESDNYLTQIRTLAEPWEDNTRIFSNGDVRIAVLDTWDPANSAVHLMVLYTPNDWIEADGRNCMIVSDTGGLGFQNISLIGMVADYDPTIGFLITLAAERYNSSDESVYTGALLVTLNRATNLVTAHFE